MHTNLLHNYEYESCIINIFTLTRIYLFIRLYQISLKNYLKHLYFMKMVTNNKSSNLICKICEINGASSSRKACKNQQGIGKVKSPTKVDYLNRKYNKDVAIGDNVCSTCDGNARNEVRSKII